MKQKILGCYYLGHDQVEVVLREGQGAEFYLVPEGRLCRRVKIGADGSWRETLNSLLHEIMELMFCTMTLRYVTSDYVNNGHDDYLFIFTHPQFTEIAARLSPFLIACQPDLKKAWRAWHKKPKSKKKN